MKMIARMLSLNTRLFPNQVACIFLITMLFTGCGTAEVPEFEPATITIKGDCFIDEHGREVILNGINVVNKSPEDNYLFQGGPEFYQTLAAWGFNCIRFIIIWDGLEPEPGVYNESYLSEIDKRIDWAADNGIFVILDMHQDLFSVKYSDGAPDWATLDEGKPHETGAVWSDAYMLSEAVQTAFDQFWADSPAPDGIGIQEHYVRLWQHVAARYAANPAVIGYDIMNEPFPGSVAMEITPTLLSAFGQLVYEQTGEVPSETELMAAFATEENRTRSLELLNTRENYARVIDAIEPLVSKFETGQLQSMYQRVASAIREVDNSHILFLEHSYYGNLGVRSSIRPTQLTDRSPDPLIAYAPHAYDLTTDTRSAAASNPVRVNLILDRIAEKGDEMEAPVWLGEWGAYYSHDDAIVPVAQNAIRQIEKHLFSHAYWSYDQGTEENAYFKQALLRPYPAYVNGQLVSYSYNPSSKTFEMEWREDADIKAPTAIFIPWFSRLDTNQIEGVFELQHLINSDAGWIYILPDNQSSQRKLTWINVNEIHWWDSYCKTVIPFRRYWGFLGQNSVQMEGLILARLAACVPETFRGKIPTTVTFVTSSLFSSVQNASR